MASDKPSPTPPNAARPALCAAPAATPGASFTPTRLLSSALAPGSMLANTDTAVAPRKVDCLRSFAILLRATSSSTPEFRSSMYLSFIGSNSGEFSMRFS